MIPLSGYNARPSNSRVDGCMERWEADRLDSKTDRELPARAGRDLLNVPTRAEDSAKTVLPQGLLKVADSLRAKAAGPAASDLHRWAMTCHHRKSIRDPRRKPSPNERIRLISAAMLKKSANSRFSVGRNKPQPSWRPFPSPSI